LIAAGRNAAPSRDLTISLAEEFKSRALVRSQNPIALDVLQCRSLRLGLLIVLLILGLTASGQIAFSQEVKPPPGDSGVAVGGSTRDATINIGILPEQLSALVRQASELSESQRRLIENLEGKLDLNQRQISAALNILGEANVPPDQLAVKLTQIAEHFKNLQTSVKPSLDDPKLIALTAEVTQAVQAGDLARTFFFANRTLSSSSVMSGWSSIKPRTNSLWATSANSL
jgi:hypothetical protein